MMNFLNRLKSRTGLSIMLFIAGLVWLAYYLTGRKWEIHLTSRSFGTILLLFMFLVIVVIPVYSIVVTREIRRRRKIEEALRISEERSRLLVEGVKDYAIFRLDTEGRVASWNSGAERLKGYKAEEIVGRHFSCFYPPEALAAGRPAEELRIATAEGRCEDEGWRARKDGTKFWASVIITALRDPNGKLTGFAKVTRDFTQRRAAEERIRELNDALHRRAVELEAVNNEMEAFSYSVAHDLRAPLRHVDGFSQALLEDYAAQLDDAGKELLTRIRESTQLMGALIDDLLGLAQVARAVIRREPVDLSALAKDIAAELRSDQPERSVEFHAAPGLRAFADPQLMRIVMTNLLGNAWKFTGKRPMARIELGGEQSNGSLVFHVQDNGAGFDPAFAHRLFGAFQRLHGASEFPGTGIGLATVERIVHRHGGKVWAQGAVDQGATIYFSLPADPGTREE